MFLKSWEGVNEEEDRQNIFYNIKFIDQLICQFINLLAQTLV